MWNPLTSSKPLSLHDGLLFCVTSVQMSSPPALLPVILSLQEVELLLDPVAGLGDSEL